MRAEFDVGAVALGRAQEQALGCTVEQSHTVIIQNPQTSLFAKRSLYD
jgi:hypothetical protein